MYQVLFRTHSLEVVELIPLPDQSGVQMLWTNPKGFKAKPGEYVKIKFPWLQDGGDEWHPYSVYLRESTRTGLESISRSQHIHSNIIIDPEEQLVQATREEMGYDSDDKIDSSAFLGNVVFSDEEDSKLLMEARERVLDRYNTTQIFITPIGDWSHEVVNSVQNRKHLRECWVSGPYTSPFSVARQFSHLVLVATGIGITPSLGVTGAYPGMTRTKILLWSTRDKNQLRFFAPLFYDVHLTLVFYTGEEKLGQDEISYLCAFGNIFIQQSRPESISDTISSIIVQFDNQCHNELAINGQAKELEDIDEAHKSSWCVLYCGGSGAIKDNLSAFTKKHNLGWKYEMFDW